VDLSTTDICELSDGSNDQNKLEDTYPIVHLMAFRKYVVSEHDLSTAWASRLWGSMSDAIAPARQDKNRRVSYESIAMGAIRNRVREMENGQRVFHGLFKRTWNIIAALNNQFEENINNQILPWVDDLHHYLLRDPSSKAESRSKAICRLAGLYRELQA